MIDKAQETPKFVEVHALRQSGPQQRSFWERFQIEYESDMNVITLLQRIAARPKTVDGQDVAPVAWDCNCLEEVCGACTMVINGRVRQACSALVDRLLEDNPAEIELRPMTKFPVLRDLMVDRSRLFRALSKQKAWVPVDGYFDMGAGPRQSAAEQQEAYAYSQCMSCGCCMEACPQYQKIELVQRDGESDEDFAVREQAAFDQNFIGPHAIAQTMLFNQNPIGKLNASERVEALTSAGGIQVCGNAQNCVTVCPKEIPLTTAIAQAGRAATVHTIKRWFDK